MKIANLTQIEFDRNLTENTSQGRSNVASWTFSGNDFLTGLPDLQFYKKCHLSTIGDISCKFFLRKYYVFMEYYLSHTSALQIYRALRTRRHELLTHGFNEYLNKFNLDARQLLTKDDIPYRDLVRAINAELLVDYGIELKNPVEITVSNKKNSCAYEGIHFHVDTCASLDSVIKLNISSFSVLISSPFELLFQMASKLSLLELVLLISEFQGRFVIDASTGELQSNWYSPLFKKSELLAYLSKKKGARSFRKVKAAVDLSVENAASPMEVKLALRALMPVYKGGYAIPCVELNKEFEIQNMSGIKSQKKNRAIDLLLSIGVSNARGTQNVALEYNGSVHESIEVAGRDYKRSNELLAAGIEEFVISKNEYDDIVFMDNLFTVIRSRLNLSRRHTSLKQRQIEREKRIKLWKELEKI